MAENNHYTPEQIEEHCKNIAQIAVVSGLKKHERSVQIIKQLQEQAEKRDNSHY